MHLREVTILLVAAAAETQRFEMALTEGKIRARIQVASSGEQALQRLCEEGCPDVIVIDPTLPGSDTAHVIPRIRTLARQVAVPVVVLAEPPDGGESAGEEPDRDADLHLRRTPEPAEVFDLVRSVAFLGLRIVRDSGETR